jgi:hypothetical protein
MQTRTYSGDAAVRSYHTTNSLIENPTTTYTVDGEVVDASVWQLPNLHVGNLAVLNILAGASAIGTQFPVSPRMRHCAKVKLDPQESRQ